MNTTCWRNLLGVPGTAVLTGSPDVQKDSDGSVILLLNPDGNTFYTRIRK